MRSLQLKKFATIAMLMVGSTLSLFAQDKTKNKFGKGITLLAIDTSFSMKFSARIQSLYQGQLNVDTDEYEDGFQIRRSRLKFDGFAYDSSITYKMEFAIANADINSGSIPQSGNTANIVLDAYVKWNFSGRWSLWFGQAKLPGNRERVISSQALQFVDRSNVNGRFNLDRDAGIQLHYNSKYWNLISAITMGEGRNITAANAGGYDYTLRAEYLPFGPFSGKGDYFSADLKREKTPKLSLGATYDFNDRASRERGQLGDFLTAQRDLSTLFVDSHFKYKGLSSLIEYANRTSPDGPAIYDEEGNLTDAFYTGSGISVQAGYLFKNNWEIAGRYTDVQPEKKTFYRNNKQYTIGLSRYVVEHSLKIQTDLSLNQEDTKSNVVMYRFQIEVAL